MTHKNIVAANLIVVGVVCIVFLIVWACFVVGAHAEIKIDPASLYSVTNVVDGDTFKVKVQENIITIRMLGVNTPETVDPRKPVECYGKEASNQTKALLKDQKVRLTFNPNREMKDKYGRYLAYVYRGDGLFINESLVQDGYAREYTYGTPYSFQSVFRADEKVAKKEKKGLWSACVNK